LKFGVGKGEFGVWEVVGLWNNDGRGRAARMMLCVIKLQDHEIYGA